MKRIWTVLLAVAMLGSIAMVAGCSSTASAGSTDEFVFANSGAYKPFSFDKGGKIVGFDVDIANEIAKRLDRTPVMKSPVPFDALIQGLKTNKYDALVASHGITEARAKAVDFSRPYYRSGAQIFVAEGNTLVKGPTDLKGMRIGVVKASTYLDLAKSLTDEAKVTSYDSDVIALQDLGTGRVDAVITDKLVGLVARNEAGLKITAVGPVLQQDEMAIAVQKGDTKLLAAIDGALNEMIADGTYETISKRWFGENILGE
jgi:polar amino acid transport system substrate-binding protein